MAKRKKKNQITLIALLLALILLIGFYVWYTNKKEITGEDKKATEETEETTDSLILATMDTALMNTLYFKNKEADMKLFREEELWKSEATPDRPINQSYVKNMINIIDEVKAIRLVNEKPEDLDEYGLSEPSVYVQATQTDGKTLTLRIGTEAAGGEGYYGLVNDKEAVYLLDITFGTGLAYSDTDMTDVEGGPKITAENIHHIEVINRDNDDFELLYDPDNKIVSATSGLFAWKILKPYEEGYTADSAKVSELLPNYATFKFITCVDYQGDDLGKYGLDNPAATVFVEYYEYYTETLDEPVTDPNTGEEITEKTYYDDKNFKIYVGNPDEQGNYYVRKEGSNAVYTMKVEEVDKMLQVDAFKLMSSFINIPNIDSVNKIEVAIEGKPYTMEIKRKTVKAEDGNEKTEATYYYNGKVTEEDIFKDVYQVMISAGYDAKINGEVDTSGLEPILTISYHLNKEDKSIVTTSFLPYNDSFYLVDNGNTIRFVADKREIDEIAAAIKEFKQME